ncbi:hypothetical protein E4N82_09045 [Treponema denticola]|uniref:hypothetical protein n=1 Tax=Treponema denticola TaxID=158 RepID=UPI00403841CB
MEFDESRVYTALNADELKIGSRCIFADDLNSLREKTQEAEHHVSKLAAVKEEDEIYRFDNYDDAYALAYLIEPPDEPKYKPFESIDKAMEAIKKHGGWVKWKDDDIQGLVVGKSDDRVKILQDWVLPEELFEGYVFADDGSPCGELVEE